MTGQQIIDIYHKMVADRGDMDTLWAEVVRFCYPQERQWWGEYGMNDFTPGRKRGSPISIYPVSYAYRLASSLTNSAFPSNDDWFELTIGGTQDQQNDPTMKEWCRAARDYTEYKIRQGSNFYTEVGALMHGLVTLGTGAFYTYYKKGSLRFRYIPIHKNVYIARNSDGDIDMVALLHEWTAKEAIEEYGDLVGKTVKEALAIPKTTLTMPGSDNYERFKFVQLIYPKTPYGEKYNPAKGELPYADVTVEFDTANIVRVAQHKVFPIATPRFYVNSDDLYGSSPAIQSLPLVRAMNTMKRTVVDAGVRAIKPAIFINSMTSKPISIEAGAINRIAGFNPDNIWTYPSPSNFNVGFYQQGEQLEELKQAFMIDIFQAIEQTSRMTATEVTERVRQKMEAVAPVVSRIHKEFSSVVVRQCLELLIEYGEIAPPPNMELYDFLQVQYKSALDANLQMGKASKIMTFLAQMGQMEQIFADPDMTALLNKDEFVKQLVECNMLPAGMLRSEKEKRQIREQQAQAAEQQQQLQARLADSQAGLNYAKQEHLAREGTPYNGMH